MKQTDAIQSMLRGLEERAGTFTKLSDEIWSYAETAYTETRSAAALREAAEREGFRIESPLAGIETAFSASYGSGAPVIGILGEFDALAGLSQRAGALAPEPLIPGGNGHGCGHNLLGAGSLAAATAVKRYLSKTGTPGTVVFYACPAEEGGSAKAFLARDGAFQGLSAALTWHPGDANAVMPTGTLANIQLAYSFTGKSAHAAAAPHLGRSALDAVELMNVGANYLREHIVPDARLHYAVTNTGGTSPNVVQARAEVVYLIRAPKVADARAIADRVDDIARGAALMTGTTVSIRLMKACADFVQNHALQGLLAESLAEVGLPAYDAADVATAADYQKTMEPMPVQQTLGMYARLLGADVAAKLRPELGQPINGFFIPYRSIETVMPASTDVGDVSYVCPTAQFGTATCAAGTPGHSWQMVAQGTLPLAHKGLLQAAKVLALTAVRLFTEPALLHAAQQEHALRVPEGYCSAIPADVRPGAIGEL